MSRKYFSSIVFPLRRYPQFELRPTFSISVPGYLHQSWCCHSCCCPRKSVLRSTATSSAIPRQNSSCYSNSRTEVSNSIPSNIEVSSTDLQALVLIKNVALSRSVNAALLRTCRLVNHEAQDFLYSGNFFSCSPRNMTRRWGRGSELSQHNISLIRNLRFAVGEWDGISGFGRFSTPKLLVEAMTLFSACSLRRITLDLKFNTVCHRNPHTLNGVILGLNPMSYSVRSRWAAQDYPYFPFLKDASVAQAVSQSQISKEIRVELTECFSFAGQHLTPFVKSLAKTRGWACEVKIDGVRSACVGNRLRWVWSLQPSRK